jgi:HAD superfamily hydrolase (TIGR01662 family)
MAEMDTNRHDQDNVQAAADALRGQAADAPNGTITAVLFDLDGTLRHNQPNGYDVFVDFLKELGYELTPKQWQHGHRWTHYYWSVSPDMVSDLAEFENQSSGFWRRYTQRQLEAMGVVDADLPGLAARISAQFDTRYSPSHHVPDDVIPTLRRLQERGYTIGLVSNRSDPLDALVAELGLADFFVFTLSAGQANAWKPAPAIFEQAIKMAGCTPEATVYVGDNYYADVEGARAAGLIPILIDPYDTFPDPGCPVIRSMGELEAVLAALPGGTNSDSPAS